MEFKHAGNTVFSACYFDYKGTNYENGIADSHM